MEPNKPIILVTCAAGSTGREVVKALSATGAFRVRAGVRDVEKASHLFSSLPDVEVVKLDESESATKAAFTGLHGLYLLIATPGDPSFDTWMSHSHAHFLSSPLFHIVFHSSYTAVPDNPVPSNRIAHAQELELRNSGIPYTVLRPTFFHQNTEKYYIPQIKNGKIIASSHGGKYTVVDVRDIAAAASSVFLSREKHIGKSYFLTTEITNDYEHAKLLSEALGTPIEYLDVSRDEYRKIISQWGLSPEIVEIFVMLDQEKEEELALPLKDDLSILIGRPGIPFKQYIHEFASSFKIQNAK